MRNYIKLPIFLVTFLILKNSFSDKVLQQRLNGFHWKRLKSYKGCIKEKNIIHYCLSKLISQKMYFQNCHFQKHISISAFLKKNFLKISLSKKNTRFQSFFIKTYIFRFRLYINTFSKLLFQNFSFQKYLYKVTYSYNTYYLKCIFEIILWTNPF